eukprot:350411-Chlamydomonas_euryale.AAC.5
MLHALGDRSESRCPGGTGPDARWLLGSAAAAASAANDRRGAVREDAAADDAAAPAAAAWDGAARGEASAAAVCSAEVHRWLLEACCWGGRPSTGGAETQAAPGCLGASARISAAPAIVADCARDAMTRRAVARGIETGWRAPRGGRGRCRCGACCMSLQSVRVGRVSSCNWL